MRGVHTVVNDIRRQVFTEIARMLGYTSIHYFSRHFKKVTKMTPSEYATSVKMLSRRGRGENV